jgi:fructokinase
MSEVPLLAGVELGGTKCVCLLATGPADIREEVRLATSAPGETLTAIHTVLEAWQRRHSVAALGVAGFGPLDLDPTSANYGAVIGTPKRGWDDVALLRSFTDLSVPVGFDTDVNAAALAEGRWGRAQGLESYVYVTVGTGIGVGTVTRGQTLRGLGHSEAGHLRVPRLPAETWRGNCPFHGDCAEGLASGPAIEARAGMAGAQLPPEHPAWNEVVHTLAALFHNLVLTVVPQRIIVGGGVLSGQPQLLARVRRALLVSLGGYAHAGRIAAELEDYLTPPALGERAGPLGAIALAQQALSDADEAAAVRRR